MCNKCKELEAELALAKKRVEYERNLYEQMFLSKQANLMREVREIIGLEMDGIKDIADRIPQSNNLEKEQERLFRYLRRMEERIAELM